MKSSQVVVHRGVEAYLTIEDDDSIPEKYVKVSLWHRPRQDGENVPAFIAHVRVPELGERP